MITDRVHLVPASASDRDEFLAAVTASRDLLHPWIDAADTEARFAELLSRAEQPEFHPFVIRRRDDGRLAGAVNVSNIVRGPFQSAFTGYWAFAGSEGRGFMTHGLRAAVRHAFTALGLHRLEANIQPGNQSSIALAERCGFRFEASRRATCRCSASGETTTGTPSPPRSGIRRPSRSPGPRGGQLLGARRRGARRRAPPTTAAKSW